MSSSSADSGRKSSGFSRGLSRCLRMLEVPVGERETLNVLRNPDLQPIPAKDQTWNWASNMAYWGIISFSVGTWISANAALSVGLSYAETIGTFIIGDVVTIFFTLANSYHGTDWKVGYTISQRFVFGIYGSGLGILVRFLMSIVNYGSNAWLGGLCVNMILDSWSHHYLTLPNTLTDKVAMSTKEVIGFMIFHVITAFFYLMKPKSMNYFLIASCCATCIAMTCMIIYLCKVNGGVGSYFKDLETTVTGSERSWAWVYMISYWFGSVSPGSTNQSDYSRFATSKTAVYVGTTLALLIPTTLIPVYGVIGASTSQELYGSALWMPMDICDYWLNNGYTAGARAATFFCGLAFLCSQISYTISNCGFAAGMDLSGVLPKYVNIFRGAIFCAMLSVAVQPWNFYNKSASTFLTVMYSFGVVMTPLISVMICDNFLIRKRNYSVSQAFVVHGEYYYTWGVNWRAILAFVCGMAPGLPGLAAEANPAIMETINPGIVNFYLADSFTSFLISFFTYWILCLIFPVKINVKQDDKDYYGAFTDEEARKRNMVPFSELLPDEINEYNYNEEAVSPPSYNSPSPSVADVVESENEKSGEHK
ncbi:LANO_0G07646g1_1 [Lachancea nothofagi CBS 11611]|uniref:LANO_0G07646g1_1 n=1 Tax=Lachancea nothofagi CBS 11611 TaxID=1266666 RepID=A0A1G4KHP2_9SACH|nr:LANO_0G07646g1_1 [Lachancea nothofagi CBS 11611]